MAASSRRSAAAKKRRASAPDDRSEPPPKKKSPLFNQPQNYYAPPTISSMSQEELSEWRKEQRRKRNRESAAASRNKTRAKIEELEGEANKWKQMYYEMEAKVRCMERHVQFLTEMNRDGGRPRTVSAPDLQNLSQSTAVVSHPNSPPRSPAPPSIGQPSIGQPSISQPAVVPNAVTSFSAPPPTYSSHIAASHDAGEGGEDEGIASGGAPGPLSIGPPSIGPPAVVPNAVTSFSAPPPAYSSHIAVSRNAEEAGGVEGVASGGVPDAAPAEALSSNEAKACEQARVANPFPATDEDAGLDGYTLPDPSSDADLLDSLADTLDGEFDPNLFI